MCAVCIVGVVYINGDWPSRDIASAIKDVLDAVNEVSKKHHGDPRMREFKKVHCVIVVVDILKYYSISLVDARHTQESVCEELSQF